MAGEKIVGKIDEIQGAGGALIVRASGEQVVAKPGQPIYEGDTVISSTGTAVIVKTDQQGSGVSGVAVVGSDESAKFDSVLFDRAGALIANSSEEDPANVGTPPSLDLIRLFNQALPSAGIRTANQQSQSDKVVEDEPNDNTINRENNERLPDDGSTTNPFNENPESENPEEIPNAGGPTNPFNENEQAQEDPQKIPDAGLDTDDDPADQQTTNQQDGDPDPIIIPVDAINDTISGTEDTPLTISVLGNDIGTGNLVVSLPDASSTNGGTITVNPDGTINYEPPANFNGTDTFTYTITNNTGETDTATVTINIASVDDPTLLVADTDTTAEDTVLTVLAGSGDGVLDDDSDEDDTLEVASFTVNGTTVTAGGIATISGVGTLQLNADGGYVFTPALNFNGTVPEVTYTTNTGSSSTLNINVTPVDDDLPDAVDDTFNTNEDTPISSNVVGSAGGGPDTGVDNGKVTPLNNFDTGNGTVTLDADGNFTYTPDTNFEGTDTFTYLVTDDEGQTDTATVTINVAAVDDPTSASPDTNTTAEDTTLNVTPISGVLSNDNDVDSTLLVASYTISGVSGTQTVGATVTITGVGDITLNADGSYVFDPATNFNGTVPEITYTTNTGATSTLNITVTPVDDGAPDAIDDTFSGAQDTPVNGNVITGGGADTIIDEADVDPVTNVATTQGGTITIAADGSFTYTPPNGFNGTDTFVYTLRDTDGDTDTATITLNVGGPAVTIPGDTVPDDTVSEDSSVSDSFSISAPSGITQITIAGTNVTLVQLQAATVGSPVNIAGTNGTLAITDYTGSSTSGTVSYTYTPVGARDHNIAAQTTEAFTITTTDGVTTSSPSILDILITDTDPTANDDARSISEGTSAIAGNTVGVSGAATGDVQDTLFDANASPVIDLDFGSVDGTVGTGLAGDYGSLVVSSAGVYTYTLDNTNPNVQGLKSGESFVETFTYTIQDGDGDTDTANINVTINGVEDAPPVVTIPDSNGGATGDASVAENATLTGGTFTVTADAGLAASGTALSITVDGSPTTLTLAQLNGLGATPVTLSGGNDGDLVLTGYNAGTGVITYNFDPTGTNRDHSGGEVSENFTIVATDNEGDTNSDTLDILITDTTPTAADDSDSITEDAAPNTTTGNVITNDTESADTNASVSAVTGGTVGTALNGTYGSIQINADGSYTYTLDNSRAVVQGLDGTESATDTFTYTIVDTDGDTDTASITVTVNGQEDADPVVTIPDTNGGDPGDASVAENATLTGGTFTVTADAGLAASGTALSITVDGSPTTLTLSQLNGLGATPVTLSGGNDGDLVLTGYNSSTGVVTYNFDPTGTNRDHSGGDNSVSENFTIVATDNEGDTDTDTLDILITDTAPTTTADTNSITEDAAPNTTTGNVITNDTESADTSASVSAVNFGGAQTVGTPFSSTYGSLDLNSDGTYTYTLDNTNTDVQGLKGGESFVETFTYTIVDTDGDTSSTTLAITINGEEDAAPVVTIPNTNGGDPGDASIAENDTLTGGTFTVTADAGLAASGTALSITVDGSPTTLTLSQLNGLGATPVTLSGGNDGELVLTGYNSSTGVVTYNFDPTGTNRDHSGGDNSVSENYTIVATDNEGDTNSDTLDILITDTAPTAALDTNSITEDTAPNPITGDVLTNDTTGADTAISVSAVNFGGAQTVGTPFASTYGSLDLNSDGTYTYTLDNSIMAVQDLASGESLTETFTYTIEDTDGDTSSTTLTVTINGSDEAPIVVAPAISVPENLTDTGSFTVTSAAGLESSGTALAITTDAGTTNLTLAQLNGLGATPVTVSTTDGDDLILTGYNAGTGIISYTFDPVGTSQDHSVTDTLTDNFTIVATDTNSNSNTGEVLTASTTDTNPDAMNDARSISEGTSAIAGNAVGSSGAATGDVQDTIIDPATVTDIDFGATDGTVGTGLAGDYGSLVISSAGVYTYTLDNANPNVQGLKAGESFVETFTYTLTDDEAPSADSDTATISVTINGVEDPLPVITITDNNGGADGDESVVENATITGGTFTVTADAGLAASGTALSLTDENSGVTNLTLAQLNSLGATPVTLAGGNDGTLVLTGYNSGTGVITYNFDPTDTNRDHTGNQAGLLESYSVVATDNEGDTNSNSLDILITDTAPTANPDTNTVTEGGVATITGDVSTNDTNSSDGTRSVSAVTGGTVGGSTSGSFGNLVLNSDGSYTYLLDNNNATVNGLDAGASVVDTFTYTIIDDDGTTDSTTLTITVNGANDAPVNTVPETVGTAQNTAFAFTGSGNTVTATDVDGNLASVQVTVTNGTITLTSGVSGGASISGGSLGSTTFTISGTEADINASLATLEYTPTGGFAGAATLTTVSTDSAGAPLSDTDITTIHVITGATAPTIGDLEGGVPESTGLLRTYYSSQQVVLEGDGVSNNASSTTYVGSSTEGLIEAAGATAASVQRDTDGIGRALITDSPTVGTSTNVNEVLQGENTVVAYTGLIYLTAGSTYSFRGYTDDNLHIELGGTTVLSTQGGDVVGNFNTSVSALDGSNFASNATFTPAADGYYTLEIYGGNIDGSGYQLINFITDGVGTQLNAQNQSIYAGPDDIIAAGGALSAFVANGAGGGGHFPADTSNDVSGVSGEDISIAALPIATSNGDIVTSITLTGIPSGVIIKDGTGNTFTSTGAAITINVANSQTATSVGAGLTGVWDFTGLTLEGLTTATHGSSLALTVDATVQTLTGTGSPSTASVTGGTFNVGILASTYKDGVEPDIATVDDADDNLIVGSGVADTLTATNNAGEIIQGGGGDDTITGSDVGGGFIQDDGISLNNIRFTGNNTLYGGSGNDVIDGRGGEDIIFGGTGSDQLTGGSGSDTFVWRDGDADGSTDTILDFTTGSGGDILDLSDILVGETPETVASFLTLTGSTLTVDSNGAVAGGNTLTIELTDYSGTGTSATDLAQLISDGNLVVDKRELIVGTTASDTLNGTSANELIISNGLNDGSGREQVKSNGANTSSSGVGYVAGGSDKYVLKYSDIVDPDNNSARTNINEVRLFDFIVDDVATNSDADILDISDLLGNAANPTDADTNNDGTISAAEAAPYFNFTSHPFLENGNTYIQIDLQGGFTETIRSTVGNNADGNSGGVADVMIRIRNGAGTGNDISEATGVAYGDTDLAIQNQIQALIDLGFIDNTI